MKPLNLITLILVIVGGLNWGLVGLWTGIWWLRFSASAPHSPVSSISWSAYPQSGSWFR